MLKYKITSSRDDVIVQDGDTCTTAKTPKCKVWVDIVARRDGVDEFNLNVVAEDSDMAKSASVSFPIFMEDPAKQKYNVDQYKADGAFRAITVGYRATTEHELVFKHPDEDAAIDAERLRGFLFAEELIEDLKAIAMLPDPPINTMFDPGATPTGYSAMGVYDEDGVQALYGVSAPEELTVAPRRRGCRRRNRR